MSDLTKTIQDLKNSLLYQRSLGLEYIPKGQGTMPKAKGSQTLDPIRETLGECTRCRLCEGRTHIVFGVGNPRAELMFIGEGPGRDEDIQGEPFVGRAGQLLTKIIEAMGMKREDVYITNIIMCRPPENRAPLPDEVATCIPFLHQKIEVIQPKVIVCLGSIAAKSLLQTEANITRIRGQWQEYRGIKVMPTYHPAYLLRNPDAKRSVWEDMKKVRDYLK